MKTLTENPPVLNPEKQPAAPAKPVLKLGLDVHLEWIVAVAQEGAQTPRAPRKFTRQDLADHVRKQIAAGFEVWCVQEACGFGFVLHHQLESAGARSLVVAPMALSHQGRKTDKLHAHALCQKLSRYVEGNTTELRPIRIASAEELRLRESSRRREFLQRQIRRMDNRGRALVWQHCHETLPSGWWGPRKWKWHCEDLDTWLRSMLQGLRDGVVVFNTQHQALTAELEQRIQGQVIPKGLGALTMAVMDAEVCDWNRFRNRKQVGSYTGCCPRVYSSGEVQRFGNIDRCGNGRLRRQLVEAVWRLLKYQTRWHAARKHLKRLGDSTAQRKKVVVAVARQLAIDLWRWRTGRCTLEQLGLDGVTA